MESKILDYVPQYDALTCQSAAIARVIGCSNVKKIRNELLRMGVPGDPAVMGEYLNSYVKEYKYHGQASLNDAIKALEDGWQLITHGWFTTSGHVIGISGWDAETRKFNAEDPWYEFHFNEWSYAPWIVDGDDMPYSDRGIWASCVVGQSADDAYWNYHQTQVLLPKHYEDQGMWLHMIKN
jgi:hypothetical protein